MSRARKSNGFTDNVRTPPGPPLIGALLRIPWEAVRGRMLQRLHEDGHRDLDTAHLTVFQYPGPQGARPSELAARLGVSKQALNYLLGELERLGYLERRPDPHDLRSRRIALTRRGDRVIEVMRDAVAEIDTAWDKHDFRPVRDLFVSKPTEYAKLTALCEHYLNVHENGKYRKSAQDVLAWVERVKGPREYTVKAVRGDFSVKLGRWYTKGPDVAVEIEVNGVKHGPTSIVKNNFDPEWNYEFPRPIRWQPGDSVRIKVIDNDFSTIKLGRTIIDHSSAEGDQLAMRLLSGKFSYEDHAIYFESDFNMPTLPSVD